MSVLDSYGPIDRMLIARGNVPVLRMSTLRRDTLSTPEFKPFSRDTYSLGRYQRASSARLARTVRKAVLLALGLIAASAVGAILAALSTGSLG